MGTECVKMLLADRYVEQKLACPPHFHYVAPSFWAWRGGEARLNRLSEFVDHIFCILPFEAEVCRSNGLAATFVGHPTLEDTLELKVCSYVYHLDFFGLLLMKISLSFMEEYMSNKSNVSQITLLFDIW